MTSLSDTSADAAAELTRTPAADGSVTLDAAQASEARRAIREALNLLDTVARAATRQHDRTVVGNRAAQLKYVQTMLGPEPKPEPGPPRCD